MLGQKVKELKNEEFTKGENHVIWDGKDENNVSVSSGVYFYKISGEKK